MKICINSNFYDNLQKFNYIKYHFWNKTTNTKTNTILFERETVASVDDILETANHFKLVDYMLDIADEKLTEDIIKKFH